MEPGPAINEAASGRVRAFKNLYEALQRTRKHPVMLLGCCELTITHLWAFTRGYEWALAVHDTDEFGAGFERGFVRFLQTNYRWREYDHWPSLLAVRVPNEAEAVERFFDLVDEYERGDTTDNQCD